MNKGFTLIELLVVVLIIGILAAIAVPKYQLVVAKAQTAEIYSLAQSLWQAQKRYYQQTNTYTTNANYLDISVPCVFSAEPARGVLDCKYATIYLYPEFLSPHLTKHNYFWINMIYADGRFICSAKESDLADKLCLGLGGVYYGVEVGAKRYNIPPAFN